MRQQLFRIARRRGALIGEKASTCARLPPDQGLTLRLFAPRALTSIKGLEEWVALHGNC